MKDNGGGGQPQCESCNAPYVSGSVVCSYCGALTAFGAGLQQRAALRAEDALEHKAEQQREQERQEAEERERARQEAAEFARRQEAMRRERQGEEEERSARHALRFSIAGLFCACFPLSIVALVQAKRAARLAAEAGMPTRTRVAVATTLGWLGLALNVCILGAGAVVHHQENQRQEELAAKLSTGAAQEKLDRQTACELLELHLLKRRGDDTRPFHHNFNCDGSLQQDGKLALLRVSRSASDPIPHKQAVSYACLERDSAWWVRAVGDDIKCLQTP
ncbi:hypothetical protein [Myxococcus stipitatus]|uniref:hypothetical protein n=1 Tax=Myxococcus stipitatus TaxID=83455 RepID=UPI0030CC36EE